MAEQAFYWGVVGDGNPEPIGVKGEHPNREAYTIGCPDPFMIDQPDCPCRLLTEAAAGPWAQQIADPMDVPENTLDPKVRRAAQRAYRDMRAHHGYAGWGR